MLANLLLRKLDFRKTSKFSWLLKINPLFYFKPKQFLLFSAYFCSEVIILILSLFNILRPVFWYTFSMKDLKLFRILLLLRVSLLCFGISSFYKSIISFSLLGINCLDLWQRFFTHLCIKFYIKGTLFLSRQFFSVVIIIFCWLLAIKKT